MSGIHIPVTADIKNFVDGMNTVKNSVKSTMDEVEESGHTIEETFVRIKNAAALTFAGFSGARLIKDIANVRGEFQQLEVAFSTMLGSEEKATDLMNQLVKTAAITPFDLKGVADGAKSLMAYGTAAEDVNETLIRLGDIAAGMSIPLNDLVYLYGTTMVQGRMFTQDLRQFQGRGIPIAEELAKVLKTTKDQIPDLVTAGKVTSEVFNQAIVNMTEAGSKFGGLMEKQSKTIKGQISNIEDAIDVMFNEIGKSSEGLINGALGAVSTLVENYQTLGKILIDCAVAFGTYKTALMLTTAVQAAQTAGIGALTTAETIHYGWLVLCEKAQALLNKTMLANPYVLVATAVMTMVAAMVTFKHEADGVGKAIEEANLKVAKSHAEVEAKMKTEQQEIDELFNKLRKAEKGTNEYKEVKDKILKQYGQYLQGLNNEISTLNDVEGAYKRVAAAARDAARAKGREAAISQAQSEYTQNYSEAIGKIYDQLTKTLSDEQAKKAIDIIQTDLKKTGQVAEDTQRTLHKYGVDYSLFGDLNKAEQGLITSTNKINVLFGDQEEQVKETAETVTKLSEDYKKAETNYRNAKNWLAQIEKNKADYTAKEYQKAVEDAKAAKEVFEKLGGDPDGKKNKGGANAAKDLRNRTAKQIAEELEYQEEMQKIRQNALDAIEDARIAAIKNDGERERAEQEEQHKRNLRQIQEQANEMKKAIYEHNKTVWENSHKDSPYELTEAGKARWSAIQLSQDQQSIIDAREKKENEEHNRRLRESLKNEEKAQKDVLYRYIQTFGDYNEQRAAIYEKANDEICALQEQMTDDMTEEARQAINQQVELVKKGANDEVEALDKKFGKTAHALGDLFADASKKSISQIDNLIKKYKAFMQFYSNEGVTKDDLVNKFGFTDKEIEEITNKLKTGEISLKEYQDGVEKLQHILSNKSPWKSFTTKIEELNEKINKSIEKEDFDTESFGESLQTVGDMIDQTIPQLERFGEAMGTIFHFDKSEYEDAIKGIQNFGSLAKGIGQIYSGDYIGGVTNAASGIAGFYSMLTMEEENARASQLLINMLNDHLAALNDSVIRLTDKMDDVYGAEVLALEEEARQKAQKQQEISISELRDSVFKNDFIDFPGFGKNRLAYKIRELYDMGHDTEGKYYDRVNDFRNAGFSEEMIKLFLGGDDWEAMFANMTDEEIAAMLKDIKENHEDLWAEIINLNDGYGEEFFNSIIDAYDQLEEIELRAKEAITQTSFDEVFNNFMSSLEDFANGSEDVFDDIADNWQKMVNKMVLYNIIGNEYKEKLKKWYEMWVEAYSGDEKISENEIEELRYEYNKIFQDAQKEIEQLRDMGIISATGENALNKDQTATMSAADKITYDQMEEFTGILTAVQIAGEQRLDVQKQILYTLQNMSGITSGDNSDFQEIRGLIGVSNDYLLDIKRSNREILEGFSTKIDKIINQLNNI